MTRRRLTSRQLLLVYAVSYLSLIALAPNARVVVASVGGCVVVLAVGLTIHQSRPASRHAPGKSAQLWVAVTSAVQGGALIAGLLIGHVVSWYLLLPVVLTAWAAHLVAIGLAMRRPVDAWLVSVAVMTASALWISVLDQPSRLVTSPIAGGLAAGVCATYAHVTERRPPKVALRYLQRKGDL